MFPKCASRRQFVGRYCFENSFWTHILVSERLKRFFIGLFEAGSVTLAGLVKREPRSHYISSKGHVVFSLCYVSPRGNTIFRKAYNLSVFWFAILFLNPIPVSVTYPENLEKSCHEAERMSLQVSVFFCYHGNRIMVTMVTSPCSDDPTLALYTKLTANPLRSSEHSTPHSTSDLLFPFFFITGRIFRGTLTLRRPVNV